MDMMLKRPGRMEPFVQTQGSDLLLQHALMRHVTVLVLRIDDVGNLLQRPLTDA